MLQGITTLATAVADAQSVYAQRQAWATAVLAEEERRRGYRPSRRQAVAILNRARAIGHRPVTLTDYARSAVC